MNNSSNAPKLILASTSAYRRVLLERYGVPFEVVSPEVAEGALPNEQPIALAQRLARLKAEAAARRSSTHAVLVGSDQLAACGQQILGKPVTPEHCRHQLQLMSGQRVVFYTAVHVIDTARRTHEAHTDLTTVEFRLLGTSEIDRYVARERPFDCAGGFKVEGLGIALFERVESQDPTALMGLPLIWLAGALRRAGFLLP